jgi:hypothetical protein
MAYNSRMADLNSSSNDGQIKPEDFPYFDKLKAIRSALEYHCDPFPKFKCCYATEVINKVLGLTEVAGTYIDVFGTQKWHAWNYDIVNGVYVDITADQFGNAPEINVSPVTAGKYQASLKNTDRQRDYDFPEFDDLVERLK